jgi:molybdopterin synthase sulfur carrier subunit
MKIQLRFFASLREALGAQEMVELPEGSTVAALRDRLLERGGRYAEVLAPTRAVRCAVNQAMAAETTVIEDGAEVAFFPPVTGG